MNCIPSPSGGGIGRGGTPHKQARQIDTARAKKDRFRMETKQNFAAQNVPAAG
ncbi:MAG: hypothetical protein FD174_1246 [Geobacteraceae bacterium]|nr:MAG: hypothetical protein FD174_1246 [Geobacteraceae bacterium]